MGRPGVSTRYGVDGHGIVSRWRRYIPHSFKLTLRPTRPPVQLEPVPPPRELNIRGMPLTTQPRLRKNTAILLFFLCAFMAGYTANFFTLTQLNLHLISTASLLKLHRDDETYLSQQLFSAFMHWICHSFKHTRFSPCAAKPEFTMHLQTEIRLFSSNGLVLSN